MIRIAVQSRWPKCGHALVIGVVEVERRHSFTFSRVFAIVCLTLVIFQASLAARRADDKRMGFTVSDAPWTLTLPVNDFVVERRQFRPDGRSAYFMMSDEKTHLNVSLFIESVADCDTSKSCRDMVWKAGNPGWENPQNVVQSAIGEVHCFEFLVPSFRGQPVQQQHMYAEFVVDGFWVDLHISKMLYETTEHELFERIVKSIKFEPKENKPTKNSKRSQDKTKTDHA
ncbi:MAG TPA: hypothetical protein VN920_13720 [Pyrinomonadaceae bacterium]|nr:hypothetical protein [Pyrinomonadaceae bacterium]